MEEIDEAFLEQVDTVCEYLKFDYKQDDESFDSKWSNLDEKTKQAVVASLLYELEQFEKRCNELTAKTTILTADITKLNFELSKHNKPVFMQRGDIRPK